MPEIEDKSLLKCTIKKSVDVLKKVVLYGLYSAVTIILITAIAAVGYLVWLGFHSSLVSDTISVIWLILTSLGTILLAIPWYVYVGVIALLAIPVYSLIWCIARELTEEDWKSDEAKSHASFIFMSSFILSAFSAFFAYTQSFNSIDVFNFIFGFAIILAFIGTISVFVIEVSLFPGAYLHYRRRMKLEGV